MLADHPVLCLYPTGKAAWEPKPPSKPKPGSLPPNRALIYWRTPDEWGQKIHQWVSTGTVKISQGNVESDEERTSDTSSLKRYALLLQVISTGQNRSIMTFFELTEGDLVEDQGKWTCDECEVMSPRLLLSSLKCLLLLNRLSPATARAPTARPRDAGEAGQGSDLRRYREGAGSRGCEIRCLDGDRDAQASSVGTRIVRERSKEVG